MLRLLKHFKPALPPVAVLLEPPQLSALRVTSARKCSEILVEHEEPMPILEEGFWPSVDQAKKLASDLLIRLGQPKRVSLVLGDPFFRMQVLTLEEFPRQEKERQQVILWHVRKALNAPVDALRLRYEVLKKNPGAVTLWLTFCPEEPARVIEEAFSSLGCQVGYMGAASVELFNLGLAKDIVPAEGACLLINRTPAYLSFLFTEDGRPSFFRCKETRGMDDEGAEAERMQQELRLTLAYHHEKVSSTRLTRIVVRRYPEGVPLPLEEVVEDGTQIVDWASILPPLPGGRKRGAERLPLFGLLESN